MPLPLPLLPEVMVSHDALLEAVQEQPPLVVTTTLLLPPVEGHEALTGEVAKPQPKVVALAGVDRTDSLRALSTAETE